MAGGARSGILALKQIQRFTPGISFSGRHRDEADAAFLSSRGTAVRRTESLSLAYAPAIHVFVGKPERRRLSPGRARPTTIAARMQARLPRRSQRNDGALSRACSAPNSNWQTF